MSRFGDLVSGNASTPPPTPVVESTPPPAPVAKSTPPPAKPKRARDKSGHYIADDPSTPENEAWVGGVTPKRKKRSRSKK